MVRYSKFTLKKKIYEKFEKFLFKLVWRETLFNVVYSKNIKIKIKKPNVLVCP